MTRFARMLGGLVALALVAGSTGGCTIKATLKTTTDGFINVLSSTSGKSWWNEDGLVKREERVNAFVAMNYDNLTRDIARGDGEYVATLSALLGIPADRREAFEDLARDRYAALVAGDRATPTELVTALTREVPGAWLSRDDRGRE